MQIQTGQTTFKNLLRVKTTLQECIGIQRKVLIQKKQKYLFFENYQKFSGLQGPKDFF